MTPSPIKAPPIVLPPILTAREAFAEAQKRINAKCGETGVAPLTGKDIALIAAWTPFEKAYNRVLAGISPNQASEFNKDVVAFAMKCIVTAILS